MNIARPALLSFAIVAALAAPGVARADSDWQKSYPVSSQPSLTFSTGDSSAEARSCGDCTEIRIRVEWNDRHSNDYTITESQTGGHVNFELHEKLNFGVHFQWGNRKGPHVTFEMPQRIDLDGRTADGALKVYGLQGTFDLHTSDGSVDVSDVSGAVHLKASDGSIHIHNASGTLESRSSDGSVKIDGKFSGIQVHTSDGSLDVTLADGSKLETASNIEASDGSVRIHVASSLAADLEVHTGDGHVDCNLPLVLEGYHSNSDSHHGLRGKLNGGGVPLTIHTNDGNVTIASI